MTSSLNLYNIWRSSKHIGVLIGAGLLFSLASCTDPISSTDDNGGAAVFELHVDKNLILTEPKCFVDEVINGELNMKAYIYTGIATLPGDVGGGGVEPFQIAPISLTSDFDYVFAIRILNDSLSEAEKGQGVIYRIAVVCDVDKDQPSRQDSLTYIKHETYYVAIKSTVVSTAQGDVGLINNVYKPTSHIKHGDPPFGLSCNYCHFESPNFDFLVTQIDHDVVSTDCITCHTASGSAQVAMNHVSTIPTDPNDPNSDCALCHVEYMWLRLLPNLHDQLTSGCDTSSCHEYQQNLTFTTHSSSQGSQDCVACHFTTFWSPRRPII